MRRRAAPVSAALGLTVKSGWATAVLLGGKPTAPHVVDCRRIELSDPAVPACRQPYHASFGTARRPGRELRRLIASVRRFGRSSVSTNVVGAWRVEQKMATLAAWLVLAGRPLASRKGRAA